METLHSKVVGDVFADSKKIDHRKSGARVRFHTGSTQREVLAAQGTPTKRTDRTWYYGASEVYFVNNRVVGWRNSVDNPLQIE
jgi:hypothetical protein